MNWGAFPARFDTERAAQMEILILGLKVPALHAVRDMSTFKFWEQAYMYLSCDMGGLVIAHVAAALRHRFIKGDDVMQRMWRPHCGS